MSASHVHDLVLVLLLVAASCTELAKVVQNWQ
jgi:hypothetical protein